MQGLGSATEANEGNEGSPMEPCVPTTVSDGHWIRIDSPHSTGSELLPASLFVSFVGFCDSHSTETASTEPVLGRRFARIGIGLKNECFSPSNEKIFQPGPCQMRVPYGTVFMRRSRQTNGMFCTEHTSDSEHGGSTAVVTPGAELSRYVSTHGVPMRKTCSVWNRIRTRVPSFEGIKPPMRRWRGSDLIEAVL